LNVLVLYSCVVVLQHLSISATTSRIRFLKSKEQQHCLRSMASDDEQHFNIRHVFGTATRFGKICDWLSFRTITEYVSYYWIKQ